MISREGKRRGGNKRLETHEDGRGKVFGAYSHLHKAAGRMMLVSLKRVFGDIGWISKRNVSLAL